MSRSAGEIAMPIPQVTQLRFTRGKWLEGLEGITREEAEHRHEPMNSIGWMVGHLAAHEQLCWLEIAQGRTLVPELRRFMWGQPASTPDLHEVVRMWSRVIDTSESYLDALTIDRLAITLEYNGKPYREPVGTMFHRLIYHYWFHLGEMQAVRQLLGHTDLPNFVGRFDAAYWYAPESG